MRRSGRYLGGGGTVGIPSIVGFVLSLRTRHFVKAMKIFRLVGLFYRGVVLRTPPYRRRMKPQAL